MTERLHFIFSLSCIGEGNGNTLQCSCLETPRDGGAWWAAVSGVAQSRTRLKRLSSSSSIVLTCEVLRLLQGGCSSHVVPWISWYLFCWAELWDTDPEGTTPLGQTAPWLLCSLFTTSSAQISLMISNFNPYKKQSIYYGLQGPVT